MAEILISVAARAAEYLVSPIGRRLGYLFHYSRSIANLREEVEKLDAARGKVQRSVDEAIRKGHEIESDVHSWLTDAQEMLDKAEEFMEDEKKSKACFNGLFPNFISRYRTSKEAKKKMEDVIKSQREANNFERISYLAPLPGIGSALVKQYEDLESRLPILEEIMEALQDSDTSMIGVWGMGGVGKTTLVMQAAKLAEEQKLFDKVVMVFVSPNPNFEKIQTEIADILGLNLEEKSEVGKARRQIEILKKNKLLIILDDIWTKLDLEAVGIPHGDHKGCKMVLTSRSVDVLSQDMGVQKNFQVRHLSNEEAWHLFESTAGDSVMKTDLQTIAKKIATECGGLPIALVTVAKALRGKSLPCWEDALRQLTSCIKPDIRGMDENVYKSLELSCNYLDSEDARALFFLCGFLGYADISMDDLLKYILGLGLFRNMMSSTLEQSKNRLHMLVDSLKASSLLLDTDKEEFVRMHDVVRDVAIAIAAKDPCPFVVNEAAPLQQYWSNIHESARYFLISLTHKHILELPQTLVCSKLEFFLLDNGGGGTLTIPDSFFGEIGQLKVLDLTRIQFPISLPSSLRFLANLRTLCLDCCKLGDIALIGELKKLEVLSFAYSDIKQLPREIAKLTCLRLLDLKYCYKLKVIPRNVLSSLSRLEHLCMRSSFVQWEDEEIHNEESNACFSELKHSSCLTSLDVKIPDVRLLPKDDILFEKLTRYAIFIGNHWGWSGKFRTNSILKLDMVNRRCHLVDAISKLLKTSEELHLRELSGAEDVYELDSGGFLKLKHLHIEDSPEIQYIINSKKCQMEHGAFPLLESLYMEYLPHLKEVCHGPIPIGSFSKLKTLAVEECDGLKYLLLLSTARCLLQLEKLSTWRCKGMKEIIARGSELEIKEDGDGLTNFQLFPKLRYLKLAHLPELINFEADVKTTTSSSPTMDGNLDTHMPLFSHEVVFANLEKLKLLKLVKLREIWHHQVPVQSFCNLQFLSVFECPLLLNVIPSNLIKRLQNLEMIYVTKCEVLEQVFDIQGLDQARNKNVGLLPKLRVLEIEECHGISVVIPSDMLCILHNLEELIVRDCDVVKEIIETERLHIETFSRLRELELVNLPILSHLSGLCPILQNLQTLCISNCGSWINLFTPSVAKSLKQLKNLEILDLNTMKEVLMKEGCEETDRIIFPELEHLRLWSLPNLTSFCSASYSFEFPSLESIEVEECPMMETFCRGSLSTPRLRRVNTSSWKEDLNTIISKWFVDKP